MKKTIIKTCFIVVLVLLSSSCSDFDKINERPDAFSSSEVSAKYFLTGTQVKLYTPSRYSYWRANLIHGDRFAGHFAFGYSRSWWNDELGYKYAGSYTNATFGWLNDYAITLNGYLEFVKPGGDLENKYDYAIGKIMKGLYFQMYTDIFGMIPFSEVGNKDIVSPKFDTQVTIYKGVIKELNEAITTIGSATQTGALLKGNDLFFNGDLQKWKKLANSLKLRMALRAEGATGATFVTKAINEAFNGVLQTENALVKKDLEISQWASAAYGDVWWNFGAGSNWYVGKTLIDYLRNNNDPRLSKYAKPIKGGNVDLIKPKSGSNKLLFKKHVDFIAKQLTDANVVYTRMDLVDTTKISIKKGTFYVGQPTRLNSKIKSYVKGEFFSEPADWITNSKSKGEPIFPEIVFTAAEANFLKAEAIIKGLASGDAQGYYQEGIRQAMKLWKVSDNAIATFISNQSMALLNGGKDENLEKIAIQRWIAAYTDGFEAWAIVRDTGYPKELAKGVSDLDIYGLGTLNGKYPQRMRYGTQAQNTNGENLKAAIKVQGADEQSTKLWWAKKN